VGSGRYIPKQKIVVLIEGTATLTRSTKLYDSKGRKKSTFTKGKTIRIYSTKGKKLITDKGYYILFDPRTLKFNKY
jgi:5-deoxy-D-glucuronate isomerase